MADADQERRLALAAEVVAGASRLHLGLATAESLTAGLVAATIASVPGASAALRGGAVTYTDDIKQRVLGVAAEVLARHSAVSRETAREMARGARRLFAADLAVSLTGYAGPGGGTPADPVGTVHFGVAGSDGVSDCAERFEGSRDEVRLAATERALTLLRARIEQISCG